MANTFGARSTLTLGDQTYTIYRLSAIEQHFPNAAKLPFSLKVLLENLLRTENGLSVTDKDIEALATWDPAGEPDKEIAFTPARTLMQDFTGVPAIVDLAAMRDAMKSMGGDPKRINPLSPVELVIDHSVQVDDFGTPQAFGNNTRLEYERNQERYSFLRWGQSAFRNFKVVPPETGIVHQVNLEYLARVVFVDDASRAAYPDTLVGTDSHTTMINGLGVLGWGVGGIEAEAAMLGQPVSMLIPQVLGFRLFGKLQEGATATDLVLTITQMLRKKGVVGKFVEFFGEGIAALPVADRATIANMAPEYGATCGIFPVDQATLQYLRMTGRMDSLVQLVEAYYKEQGMFHTKDTPPAVYSDTLELDLGQVEASMAGPSRPQDRVKLGDVRTSFAEALPKLKVSPKKVELAVTAPAAPAGAAEPVPASPAPEITSNVALRDGSVVIAAITSCTNTSNPSVMLAAGLLARNAVAKGLQSKPWVKTSLGPGSKVVTEYYKEAGLMESLEALHFNLVGYGCTTCIGNSGPLPDLISQEIRAGSLVVASVLSGNRNFEGRVHPEVRANYLASPPLVVAYALAGRIDIDWQNEPIGHDPAGKPVMLADIWPSQEEVQRVMAKVIRREQFASVYAKVFQGDDHWRNLPTPAGELFDWDPHSTYVKNPPYFAGMGIKPEPVTDIAGARVLALLGDSITTDHISPAGSIKEDSPAGWYLKEHGVAKKDFNQYGARRGNHEVMMRGTFANVRLKNALVPGVEGGVTRHLPDGEQMSIYDASMKYQAEDVPLLVIAGKEYGSGSSRDWAAKGTKLLGIRAVIADSYERIHRSNLVGMGVLPLQFLIGENADTYALTGEEVFDIAGLAEGVKTSFKNGRFLNVKAKRTDGTEVEFRVIARLDTPQEILYYLHGGILPYVLRQQVGAR